MSDTAELKQKASGHLAKAQKIIERAESEGRKVTAEEDARFERLMKRHNDLVQEAERIEERERMLNDAAARERYGPVAGRQDFTEGAPEHTRFVESPEERSHSYRALDTWMRTGDITAYRDLVDREYRGQGQQLVGSSGKGGVTVPTEVSDQVREAMKAYGGMRRVAQVIVTDHGRDIDYPTIDDTANTAELVGEASSGSGSTNVPFSKVTIEAPKYKSGIIKISRELLQDSEVDVAGIVTRKMRERIRRKTEEHYATRSSTESSGPHGVVNVSTGAVAVAQGSSNLTFTNLKDLKYAIDPAYMTNPFWQFNNDSLSAIAKITDSNGQFLLQPRVSRNAPELLLGHPYVVNQSLDGFGTSGNKPVWFGDWSSYLIRDVRGIRMVRLEERYAETDEVGFIGYFRSDGKPIAGTTRPAQKPLRCIVQTT